MDDKLVYPRQQALQSTETLATVVHAIIVDKYGEEAYDWDPVTVFLEAKDDFNAEMSSQVMDRWCAMQVVMTSDAFFKRVDAFLNICNTLADGSPAFSSFNPVTAEEAAWAISEVALNREMLPFSYAVKKYLKMTLEEYGYSEKRYPKVFEEVFGRQPSSADFREGLATVGNDSNIELFISEQFGDMVSQFNKIPDLKTMDNLILQRGLEEAMAESERDAAKSVSR